MSPSRIKQPPKPTPLFGEQTRLALNNFTFSALTMPRAFLHALGLLKYACARTNGELGLLSDETAKAIQRSALDVAKGDYDEHFPVDVFQTGSGTSTNMNANEVIATLASAALERSVHPNDHVNLGQSSNDVIPSCIHISACLELRNQLLPALQSLVEALDQKGLAHQHSLKTGRTHLMDALPVSFGQEFSAWSAQIKSNIARVTSTLARLEHLPIGGTAVGTGVNAHPDFASGVCQHLSEATQLPFSPAWNKFELISSQDSAVELSGQLKVLATSLMKINQDLRWMNSGPISGLGEITLPKLQAGSSIMPGKVNPVIPEAIIMACAQVTGNDTTITISGQGGNFQLNTMLPVIAYNLLQSLELMRNSARALAEKVITPLEINQQHMSQNISRNPILATKLNPLIGYEAAAEIARTAYLTARPVLEVAAEMTDISHEKLAEILDPKSFVQQENPAKE